MVLKVKRATLPFVLRKKYARYDTVRVTIKSITRVRDICVS